LRGAGQLVTGRLSDTIGRKPLIVTGMIVQAAALMLPGSRGRQRGPARRRDRDGLPGVAGPGAGGVPVLARPRLRGRR